MVYAENDRRVVVGVRDLPDAPIERAMTRYGVLPIKARSREHDMREKSGQILVSCVATVSQARGKSAAVHRGWTFRSRVCFAKCRMKR
jgi:hypothetical protein